MADRPSKILDTKRPRNTPKFRDVEHQAHRPDTGEAFPLVIQEKVPVRRPSDKRGKGQESFAFIYAEAREIPWRELTGSDLRILMWVLTHLSYNEPSRLSQLEAARELGINKDAGNRAFRHLMQLGLLVQVEPREYFPHPDYFWRGTPDARIAVRDRLVRAGTIRKAKKVEPYS